MLSGRRGDKWLWMSIGAAILAIAGSITALSVRSIYSGLTPAFLPQAIAQDIASLAVVSPSWLLLAVLALRGSVRAKLLWLGVTTFTVYNYVIYTFSVPFGPLFPLWVAVLGLSLYSLIGGISTTDHAAISRCYTNRRAAATTAWVLIVVAALFAFVWLSEDLPALISRTVPKSVTEMQLPTNPVHILDLGFFLPAAVYTGVLLLRRVPLGYTAAPAFLVFLILTGLPILLTPVVQSARGAAAGWGVEIPIATLTIALLVLLTWLMLTVRGDSGQA